MKKKKIGRDHAGTDPEQIVLNNNMFSQYINVKTLKIKKTILQTILDNFGDTIFTKGDLLKLAIPCRTISYHLKHLTINGFLMSGRDLMDMRILRYRLNLQTTLPFLRRVSL